MSHLSLCCHLLLLAMLASLLFLEHTKAILPVGPLLYCSVRLEPKRASSQISIFLSPTCPPGSPQMFLHHTGLVYIKAYLLIIYEEGYEAYISISLPPMVLPTSP